jgi:hypothetical protein
MDDKGIELDSRFSIGDFAPEALARAKKDVAFFMKKVGKLIAEQDLGTVGHDLWLTRNHHGAGFWDRDCYSKETGQKLSDIAGSMGEQNVVEGDDGKLYLEGGKTNLPTENIPRPDAQWERGPDQFYDGRAIRIDLKGYGGAFWLGWEGGTMGEAPEDYAHLIMAAPDLRAALDTALDAIRVARAALLDRGGKGIEEAIEVLDHAQPEVEKAIAKAEGK